jgi:hypothetical protein
MIINPPYKIYVNKSPIHGLGVFAKEKIRKDEVFEICPIIDMGMNFGESSQTQIGGQTLKQTLLSFMQQKTLTLMMKYSFGMVI